MNRVSLTEWGGESTRLALTEARIEQVMRKGRYEAAFFELAWVELLHGKVTGTS